MGSDVKNRARTLTANRLTSMPKPREFHVHADLARREDVDNDAIGGAHVEQVINVIEQKPPPLLVQPACRFAAMRGCVQQMCT